MSETPTSFRDLIGLWPSLADFARDIDVKDNTAKLMRFRDSIHSSYWPALIERAKSRKIRGITLELLFQLQGQKKIASLKSVEAA